jgi:hypothetical protein
MSCHFHGIPSKGRECSRPKCQRSLVGDQSDDIETDAYMPLVFGMDTQPGEADRVRDYREGNEDIWSPISEISEAADYEEDHYLDCE